MKITQINSVYLIGDAITSLALQGNRIFAGKGWSSSLVAELFSDFWDAYQLAGRDYNDQNILISMFYLFQRFININAKMLYIKKFMTARVAYKPMAAKQAIENADIRIWHYGGYYPLFRYFHAKDILYFHGITPPYLCSKSEYALKSKAALQLILDMQPFIITDSAFDASSIAALGFPRSSIHILPPFAQLFPMQLRHAAKPSLITYGRYAMNKGIPELAKLCHEASLPLTVFGDNNQLKEYKTEYAKARQYAGAKVKILPKQKSIDGYMAQANIYISNSYHEGFGMPLIEAEAHSLPVLARRGTAMDELVQEGVNGYLFSDIAEVPALAAKILKNYAAMSRAAWRHSQGYTMEKYKERYLKILQKKA